MANLWRLETPCVIKPQQASLQLFCHDSAIVDSDDYTNAGRLIDRKKHTNKQTNRERNKQKARPLDFVIMENEILAPAKHALVVQKMDSALHHINYYPEDNKY